MTNSIIAPAITGLSGSATAVSGEVPTIPVSQQPANAQLQLAPANQLQINVAAINAQLTGALATVSPPLTSSKLAADTLPGPGLISRIGDNQALVSSVKAHNVAVVLAATEKSQVLGELSRALSSVRAPVVHMPVTVVAAAANQITLNAATLARPITLSVPDPAAITTGSSTLMRHTQTGQWSLGEVDISSSMSPQAKTSLSKAVMAHSLKSPGLVFEHLPSNTVKQLSAQAPKLATSLAQPHVSVSFHGSQLNATTAVWQPVLKLTADLPVFKDLAPLATAKLPQLPELRVAVNLLTEQAGSQDAKAAMVNMPSNVGKAIETLAESLPADKTQLQQLQQQIPQLARKLLTDTGSTQQALSQLLGILKGVRPSSSDSADVLARITTQLSDEALFSKPSVPHSGNLEPSITKPSPLVAQLQSLFAATSLPVTPTTLPSSASPSNFVAALVSLLQISLGAKALTRADAGGRSALQQSIAASNASNTGPTASAIRAGFDVTSQDKQGQLLNTLKTLLANHQTTKLTNAEARLQGQEQFYFILPFTSQGRQAPEVLISRDAEDKSRTGTDETSDKQWQLTMKLDIGAQGELLAKSEINGHILSINLYTSTSTLLTQVSDTLPFLLRKLESLGLKIETSSVQRGKIPAHLADRPYQLFETKA
ncbi:hypothetical protein IT774_13020 [Salinimonas marina]|uniref:Flagellar hook-length control protein FliK n=1 Tax=Salinimonas marina TaxID=2785918 RepID=A0A7S9DW45_9ALTE|nr:hypothetical protein [Salinimonas marina]QPG05052.1 hypothetical protein IT774_13020 [Salinimonas marina]